MSENKHTPEPWSVREMGDDCFITAAIEPGMAYGPEIMGDDYTGYGGEKRKKADARRIVACVNACVGIPIEILEAPDTDGQELARKAWAHYQQVLDANEAIQKQRDVLLAALKRAAAHISEITSFGGKYHGLSGAVVADSYAEAKAAHDAIGAVENPIQRNALRDDFYVAGGAV